MGYYTQTIPLPLAEKLKERGIPVEIVCDNTVEHSYPPEYHCETIFAEVFDWLMERGQRVYIVKSKSGAESWHGQVNDSSNTIYYDTWHDAANAAIEKAITLI